MYITEQEARIHNLIMRFMKMYQIDELNEWVEREELAKKVYFREADYENSVEAGILEREGNEYRPTSKLKESIAKLDRQKRNDEDIADLKKQYKEKFKSLADNFSYNNITKELVDLASKIHWNILPEYEEYMIVNSEIYPNDEPEEYYNHYHTLEDLYKELNGEGKNIKSKKGDVTLNKEISMRIFSRRWGHDDEYTITRTLEGWDVVLHQKKTGNKEGEALISTLKHDLINYPHSLGNYMWYLWNKADNNEMTVEQLKEDLDKIANWINQCEKSTPEGIEV